MGEVSLSHFIALHAEHYNLFGHDQATTYTLFYNASIIQDIKQKYIVIIYPFYDVLYAAISIAFCSAYKLRWYPHYQCILPSRR